MIAQAEARDIVMAKATLMGLKQNYQSYKNGHGEDVEFLYIWAPEGLQWTFHGGTVLVFRTLAQGRNFAYDWFEMLVRLDMGFEEREELPF
jgi:hypothetical protein